MDFLRAGNMADGVVCYTAVFGEWKSGAHSRPVTLLSPAGQVGRAIARLDRLADDRLGRH